MQLEVVLVLLLVLALVGSVVSTLRPQLGRQAGSLLGARTVVALALACTDYLFAAAILLFVLFGGLPLTAKQESQRFACWARGAQPDDVVAELRLALLSTDEKHATNVVNDLLEELTQHFELDVLDAVLAELPALGVEPDDRSCEVLLEANLALGNFHEVRSLAARLRAAQRLTPRMARTQLNAALETGDLSEALDVLRSGGVVVRPMDAPRLLALGADEAEVALLKH